MNSSLRCSPKSKNQQQFNGLLAGKNGQQNMIGRSKTMSSNSILFSIAICTLALALSGCGGSKPEANAEAAKPEQPFAMREAPTPQTAEGGAAGAVPQAESGAFVKDAAAAAGANASATGGLQATQNLQQVTGVAGEPPGITQQAGQNMKADSAARAAVRVQTKKGHLGATNLE